MAYVIAFNLLYSKHKFAALIVILYSMLIVMKIAGNAARIALFSLEILVTVYEY